MKAAILEKFNSPLIVADVKLGDPGPYEVRVRTAAVGVCHSDLHLYAGLRPDLPLPAVLGHEVSGIVEQVGSGVTDLQRGDHVVGTLSSFCGTCPQCIKGRLVLCQDTDVKQPPGKANRLTRVGQRISQVYNLSGFAEEILIHRSAVIKIRRDMPLDRAALIGCAVLTGASAVFRTAGVTPGSTVAVVGCGAIGLAAINGAKIAGATQIVAVDKLPHKLKLAQKFGATHVVDAGANDVVAVVKELTSGGVDYAFECVGLSLTVEQCWRMSAPGGIVTVLGLFGNFDRISLDGIELLAEKQLRGSLLGSAKTPVDVPHLVELYMQGRLNLDDLISQRIELHDINDALSALKRGEVARSVIVFD